MRKNVDTIQHMVSNWSCNSTTPAAVVVEIAPPGGGLYQRDRKRRALVVRTAERDRRLVRPTERKGPGPLRGARFVRRRSTLRCRRGSCSTTSDTEGARDGGRTGAYAGVRIGARRACNWDATGRFVAVQGRRERRRVSIRCRSR